MLLRSFSTLPRGSLFAHGEVDLKVDSNSGPAKNGTLDRAKTGIFKVSFPLGLGLRATLSRQCNMYAASHRTTEGA